MPIHIVNLAMQLLMYIVYLTNEKMNLTKFLKTIHSSGKYLDSDIQPRFRD
jgi:hypothetical protein